jgi:hypothetical protein
VQLFRDRPDAFVAMGKTNPEIAIILGISRLTVKKHLEHIFQSLGVETRTAAAGVALEVASCEPADNVPLEHPHSLSSSETSCRVDSSNLSPLTAVSLNRVLLTRFRFCLPSCRSRVLSG